MITLFDSDKPPLVTDRALSLQFVLYGFVGASKQGFGAILETDNKLKFRVGTWGSDSSEHSSNWREFTNLVDTLQEEAISGHLTNSIIIITTDNSTVESVFYKGNSTRPLLYDLIVRLRQMEMHHS